MSFAFDPCEKCEQMMQPYLDRVLTEAERLEAEAHLEGLFLLPQALPLRGRVQTVRTARRRRTDAAGAEGQAPRAAHPL